LDNTVFIFIVVGFIAQLVDGSLGMAYGVSASTILLGLGVSPAIASASVHTAEVVTTGISGLSHHRLGNISRDFFVRLVLPGMIGGAIGAFILTSFPGDLIAPFVSVYLLVMGIVILRKAFKNISAATETPRHLVPLGLTGGFFDAVGGGGWGPIVTSTLVAGGHNPRIVIGSVNAAEFFVTLVQAITFFLTLGVIHTPAVIGLIIGGIPAAPVAAYLVKHIAPRRLMVVVGCLIIVLSIRTIYLALTG
jgi:uncharacterized protein